MHLHHCNLQNTHKNVLTPFIITIFKQFKKKTFKGMENVHFQASKSGQNLENGHLQTQRTRELPTWYLGNLGDTNSRMIKKFQQSHFWLGFPQLGSSLKLFEPLLFKENYLNKLAYKSHVQYMGKTVLHFHHYVCSSLAPSLTEIDVYFAKALCFVCEF